MMNRTGTLSDAALTSNKEHHDRAVRRIAVDRRQQKTRQAVFEAFTALLTQKPYSRITVQEIIDRANIGRSTFYSHFETKDELLRAICTEIFEHVFSEDLAKEKTHDFSAGDSGLEGEICHVLYHLQDNKDYVQGLLACESGEMFMSYLKEHLAHALSSQIEQSALDVPHDYLANRLVCDFAETVRWWMKHDAYTPEDITRFFLATTPYLA